MFGAQTSPIKLDIYGAVKSNVLSNDRRIVLNWQLFTVKANCAKIKGLGGRHISYIDYSLLKVHPSSPHPWCWWGASRSEWAWWRRSCPRPPRSPRRAPPPRQPDQYHDDCTSVVKFRTSVVTKKWLHVVMMCSVHTISANNECRLAPIEMLLASQISTKITAHSTDTCSRHTGDGCGRIKNLSLNKNGNSKLSSKRQCKKMIQQSRIACQGLRCREMDKKKQ